MKLMNLYAGNTGFGGIYGTTAWRPIDIQSSLAYKVEDNPMAVSMNTVLRLHRVILDFDPVFRVQSFDEWASL